ncbi:MAG TPA: type IV pilin protein [Steroidobacteraceae bacterium]|jgi:type IV pilus assembly protein PilE|nr:type IV pilin protein [Steroidobacteraceae bacterium]
MQTATKARGDRGFTLVELMIVVAIATILLSIAVPAYMSYVRQSRRVEAKTAILDLASREERFFSTNPAGYTVTPAQLGYTGFGVANPVGSGYYYLTVCSPACAPSALAAPSFTITATPVPGQSQTADTQCTSFSVDSGGQQYSTGTGTVAYCWGN